jgi:hypothetical protein
VFFCVLYCCHRVSTQLQLTYILQRMYSTNDTLMKDLQGPKHAKLLIRNRKLNRCARSWLVIVIMFNFSCPQTQQQPERRMGKRRFKSVIPGQHIINECNVRPRVRGLLCVFINLADIQLLGCCSNGARVGLKQALVGRGAGQTHVHQLHELTGWLVDWTARHIKAHS